MASRGVGYPRAVAPAHKLLGIATFAVYRTVRRIANKLFSVMMSGAFAEFGRRSSLGLPIRIEGAHRMAIGDDVGIQGGGWLHVLGDGDDVVLRIGDGCQIGANSTVSAVRDVRLGERVLTARHIYISDHSHRFTDPTVAIMDQGVDNIEPVEIGDGVWLGEGVVVCPGVRIGAGAVIGANSVVKTDIPAGAVAVGAPARVVRIRLGFADQAVPAA